jgi:hypothetical protein
MGDDNDELERRYSRISKWKYAIDNRLIAVFMPQHISLL